MARKYRTSTSGFGTSDMYAAPRSSSVLKIVVVVILLVALVLGLLALAATGAWWLMPM
jgi:hypothetical protein